MHEYRTRVDDHFRETANLLNAMTEQYRQVYTHMANGAAALCDDAETHVGLIRSADAAADFFDLNPALFRDLNG